MKTPTWLLVALLLGAVTLGACVRRGARSYGEDVDLKSAPSPISESAEEDQAPEAVDPSSKGSFVFTVTDQSGRHPEGIRINTQGPLSQTFTSDPEGKIRVEGPAGNYKFDTMKGCYDRMEVLAGTEGRFGIARGQSGSGKLVVEWRHGVAPSPPVYSSLTPYWPPGETITIRFDVVDRCIPGGPSRVGGLEYPTFVFQPGRNIRLAAQPVLKADAEGFGYVKVTCTRDGEAELAVVDSKNPKELLNLAGSDSSSAYGGQGPSCRNP